MRNFLKAQGVIHSHKLWSALLSALTIAMGSTPAIALPLQSGIYRIGSKYIQIAAKGDRLCYQGRSRGVTTSSISPHTIPDFFVVNFKSADTKEPIVLHQPAIGNLLYGTVHNLNSWEADYQVERSLDETMKRCLNSRTSFLEEVPPVR